MIDNAGECAMRHAPESQNVQWVGAGLVEVSAAPQTAKSLQSPAQGMAAAIPP